MRNTIFLFFIFIANAYAWETLPTTAPAPVDNPTTAEKVELGKKLFFDNRLSKDNTVSCNTFHNVFGSVTYHLQFSKGIYVSGFERSLTSEMLEKHFRIKPISGLKLPLTKYQ